MNPDSLLASDTSPIISLAVIEHLHLLPEFFSRRNDRSSILVIPAKAGTHVSDNTET
ncbi:MAG: hypothetical protein GY801_34445 [bacterium]|nr:hypothetical protein [bacterium]